MIVVRGADGNSSHGPSRAKKGLPGRAAHSLQWGEAPSYQKESSELDGVLKMPEERIGQVSDFFARPVVAAIELTAPLKVGDQIHIKGHSTDLTVTVASMQVHNAPVQEAKAGDPVGVKITDRARKGDIVYKIVG
jgi:putative protease